MDSKKSKDSLQFYSDLRNKYHVSPKAEEQSSLTTSQLFLQGKVAMHICGRWCSLTYKKDKLRNLKIGYTKVFGYDKYIPSSKGVNSSSFFPVKNVVIFSLSNNCKSSSTGTKYL